MAQSVQSAERPMPFVWPEYCKGCGRCIEACPKHCISLGTEINPLTGLIPISLDLEACNGCGLCERELELVKCSILLGLHHGRRRPHPAEAFGDGKGLLCHGRTP